MLPNPDVFAAQTEGNNIDRKLSGNTHNKPCWCYGWHTEYSVENVDKCIQSQTRINMQASNVSGCFVDPRMNVWVAKHRCVLRCVMNTKRGNVYRWMSIYTKANHRQKTPSTISTTCTHQTHTPTRTHRALRESIFLCFLCNKSVKYLTWNQFMENFTSEWRRCLNVSPVFC